VAVLGVRLRWDYRADATGSGGLAVGLAVVALVANGGARRDVRPKIEQVRELTAVARLSGRKVFLDAPAPLRFRGDGRRSRPEQVALGRRPEEGTLPQTLTFC